MPTSRAVPQLRFGAQARLRALQQDIMELILERGLEPGDPLPTENELAGALGVGRNTLRESLKVLQALGVIEIRHGFGMFVAPITFDALVDGLSFRGRLSLRLHGEEALQLVDVRRSLETGLIGAAIDLMDARQLSLLEDSVRTMEELAVVGESFVAADAEFHSRLFEPLGNEMLIGLMEAFRKVYRRIQIGLGPFDEDLLAVAAAHRAIHAAVACRDKELAAELLNRHFDAVRKRIEAA